MAGPIAFTTAWLLGWLDQDKYSVRQEDISALAAMDAQHAWIMITGLCCSAWERSPWRRVWPALSITHLQ
jgi:hypothetical protein